MEMERLMQELTCFGSIEEAAARLVLLTRLLEKWKSPDRELRGNLVNNIINDVVRILEEKRNKEGVIDHPAYFLGVMDQGGWEGILKI